ERPLVPAEAPAHRKIEIARVVRDVGQLVRAVVQHVAERCPQELPLRMRALPQLREALGDIPRLQNFDHADVGLRAREPIVPRWEIENLDLLALLAVDPAPGLLAERTLLEQCAIPVRGVEVLVPR